MISPDSYHAMMVMGANYRSQFHPKVVGVTGSVGKTTTKQMTYAALAGFGETIKSYVAEGRDLNSLVSIPLPSPVGCVTCWPSTTTATPLRSVLTR